jgi:hypothetical protein
VDAVVLSLAHVWQVGRDFQLFQNTPRVALDNLEQTVAAAGLVPRALLFLQDNTA